MGEVYSKIKPVFTSQNLSLKWKLNVYKAMVISQAEYLLHFTKFSPAEIRSLDVLFHKHLRTLLRIPHPWISIQAGYPPVSNAKLRKMAAIPSFAQIYAHTTCLDLASRKFAFDKSLKTPCLYPRSRGRPLVTWNQHAWKTAVHIYEQHYTPPIGPHRSTNQQGTSHNLACLLYTSPSPRDATLSRMPSSA